MTPFDHASRIRRARAQMESAGIDVLLLSVGSDLPYLTGYRAMPLERLTMLVLPVDADPTLVVPGLEAPRVDDHGLFSVRAWSETEDPVAIVAGLAGGAATAAIGDTTWARFLLELQAELSETRFTLASPLMSELRMRKEPAEEAALRAAAEATDRIVERLTQTSFVGRSEVEVSREVAAMTIEEGHDESLFAIVASGPNAASPHHDASQREIARGDTVVVDFGGRMNGYCSDTTRTFSIGAPTPQVADAYEVLVAAQAAARAAVAPGVSAWEVDRAARDVIEAAGLGERFIHRTGHGIGMEEHERPYIVAGNELELESGMAFSIEPGIYEPDAWGMRLEDIVLCSDTGIDELNRSDRSLHVVE